MSNQLTKSELAVHRLQFATQLTVAWTAARIHDPDPPSVDAMLDAWESFAEQIEITQNNDRIDFTIRSGGTQ
jgi:hypothetical protein